MKARERSRRTSLRLRRCSKRRWTRLVPLILPLDASLAAGAMQPHPQPHPPGEGRSETKEKHLHIHVRRKALFLRTEQGKVLFSAEAFIHLCEALVNSFLSSPSPGQHCVTSVGVLCCFSLASTWRKEFLGKQLIMKPLDDSRCGDGRQVTNGMLVTS